MEIVLGNNNRLKELPIKQMCIKNPNKPTHAMMQLLQWRVQQWCNKHVRKEKNSIEKAALYSKY